MTSHAVAITMLWSVCICGAAKIVHAGDESPVYQRIFPETYTAPNGHTGAFTYHDDTYSGIGDRNLDGATLSGGTGDLSDGIVSDEWNWVGQQDANPWVGWTGFSPTISYAFLTPSKIDVIRLHTLANHQAAIHVWDTVAIRLDGHEQLQFSFDESSFGDNALHAIELPIHRAASTVEISLSKQSTSWSFLSEVEFLRSAVPPNVTSVQVDGLTWRGDSYAIPLGASDQSAPLPFSRINQVSLTFDEHVTIGSDQASLIDSSGNEYTLFGPLMSLGETEGTFVATWQLEEFLDIGRYSLRLDDGIVDDDGNSLDGEWTNDMSATSGDGIPGGDFAFTFNVLPGDVNQDGLVNIVDAIEVRNAIGTSSTLHDIDVRGGIDTSDVYATLTRAFDVLPQQPSTIAAAVPEPAGTVTLIAAVATFILFSGRKRKSRNSSAG